MIVQCISGKLNACPAASPTRGACSRLVRHLLRCLLRNLLLLLLLWPVLGLCRAAAPALAGAARRGVPRRAALACPARRPLLALCNWRQRAPAAAGDAGCRCGRHLPSTGALLPRLAPLLLDSLICSLQ